MMCHGWADAKDGMTYDFRKLTICLHDSQAQRDYLTCHQEIDSFCIIYLHVSPDRNLLKKNHQTEASLSIAETVFLIRKLKRWILT